VDHRERGGTDPQPDQLRPVRQAARERFGEPSLRRERSEPPKEGRTPGCERRGSRLGRFGRCAPGDGQNHGGAAVGPWRESGEVLRQFRDGDAVVVHSLDRLARNLDDLRRLVQDLTSRGVSVQFVKEQLTFTGEDSPMANLLLSVMGAFAEFERALIRERQREGIALAKQRGAYRGRQRSLNAEQVDQLAQRAAAGEPKTLARPGIRDQPRDGLPIPPRPDCHCLTDVRHPRRHRPRRFSSRTSAAGVAVVGRTQPE